MAPAKHPHASKSKPPLPPEHRRASPTTYHVEVEELMAVDGAMAAVRVDPEQHPASAAADLVKALAQMKCPSDYLSGLARVITGDDVVCHRGTHVSGTDPRFEPEEQLASAAADFGRALAKMKCPSNYLSGLTKAITGDAVVCRRGTYVGGTDPLFDPEEHHASAAANLGRALVHMKCSSHYPSGLTKYELIS